MKYGNILTNNLNALKHDPVCSLFTKQYVTVFFSKIHWLVIIFWSDFRIPGPLNDLLKKLLS